MDVNFIHTSFEDDMVFAESVLGPFEKHEENVFFDDTWKLEDVWVHVGLFKSKNQARKNNHGGPIPAGFSDTVIKKKRNIRVTILNAVKS